MHAPFQKSCSLRDLAASAYSSACSISPCISRTHPRGNSQTGILAKLHCWDRHHPLIGGSDFAVRQKFGHSAGEQSFGASKIAGLGVYGESLPLYNPGIRTMPPPF